MIDVTALGEALMDLTPIKLNEGTTALVPHPGGAPMNVLAMLAKLGHDTAFIGKVGQDSFGSQLKASAEASGINTRGLILSLDFNTSLAIVHLTAEGDRSFSFYRTGCADVNLLLEDVDFELIDDCRIFHFGSLSLTNEPVRTVTKQAVHYAREHHKIISYDPNYRPLLWKSESSAKTEMLSLLPLVNLLKVSEEELTLLTEETAVEAGAVALLNMGPELVLVTLGEAGAYFKNALGSGFIPTVAISAVDTTGCGDAFLGAFLSKFIVQQTPLKDLTPEIIRPMLIYANCAGALTALKPGAIPALPSEPEIRLMTQSSIFGQ